MCLPKPMITWARARAIACSRWARSHRRSAHRMASSWALISAWTRRVVITISCWWLAARSWRRKRKTRPCPPGCGKWRAACPVGSICTGAFLLGRAGLLDGKRATTHWSDAGRLGQQFPLAQVEHDRIHVRDGGLVTSAGVTAGIDLALALVAEDHGPSVALSVAKRLLVLAQRQGGQSQFSPYLDAQARPDALAAVIQRHVMEHLAEPLSVERLADIAGMSARNFARLFVKEMQITPAEFVLRARIDAARNLLEGSELPLKTIAYRCGFGSAARMRLVFAQRFGVTPYQYRDSFKVSLA